MDYYNCKLLLNIKNYNLFFNNKKFVGNSPKLTSNTLKVISKIVQCKEIFLDDLIVYKFLEKVYFNYIYIKIKKIIFIFKK